MENIITTARPYAKALFSIAKKSDDYASWTDVLENLGFIVNDIKVADIIKNPLISREDKAGFVKSLCKTKLSEKAQNLINLLSKNDRLDIVAGIRDLFEDYKYEALGLIKVTLTSAVKLNNVQQKEYIAGLKDYFNGKEVEAKFICDKSLLGGIVVRAKDTVIDFSLRAKLKRLEEALAS